MKTRDQDENRGVANGKTLRVGNRCYRCNQCSTLNALMAIAAPLRLRRWRLPTYGTPRATAVR